MEKLYHGISEKTLSIIYLFIYLFIPQRGTFFCGKDIRGVGRGAGEVGFKRG